MQNKVNGGTSKRKSDSKTPRAPPKKQKIHYVEVESGEDDDEEEAEYEVEKLLEVREKRNGAREFLVHWKGFSKKYDTWEPEENLNCQEIIEKFLESLEKAKKSKSTAKNLRDVPKTTERFTSTTSGTRASKRNSGKQR